MKTVKRTIGVLLVVFLVMSLVACSKENVSIAIKDKENLVLSEKSEVYSKFNKVKDAAQETYIYAKADALEKELALTKSKLILKDENIKYSDKEWEICEIYDSVKVKSNTSFDGPVVKGIVDEISEKANKENYIISIDETIVRIEKLFNSSNEKFKDASQKLKTAESDLEKPKQEFKKAQRDAGIISEDINICKPVIYLYPTSITPISVSLSEPSKISHSYPKYENGWNVIADTDGTLIDQNTGRKLYSLYWDGKNYTPTDMSEGFVIKGKDTINFLEEKLAILGLSEKEAEEFIIYWLPKMENSKYVFVNFRTTEEINEYMELNISKTPDTLIRVYMDFKTLESHIDIPEQQLIPVTRTGFTVVEWGGCQIPQN